jgi:hypothetical protein
MANTVVVSLILLHVLIFYANSVFCAPQYQYQNGYGYPQYQNYPQHRQYQYGYASPLTVDNKGLGYGVPGGMFYLICKDCGGFGRKKK